MVERKGCNLSSCGILAIALAATISGCATSSSRPAAQNNNISVPVKFADSTGLILPMTDQLSSLSLQLGVIAGATAGLPNETLQTDRITPQSTMQIDLHALEMALKERATTTTTVAAAYLEVTPPETKFARVSTVPDWIGGTAEGLSAGFRDSNDLKTAVGLMFVDRPCRIIGTTTSRSGMKRVAFDVTFAQEGLHWIVGTGYGPDRSIPVGTPGVVHPAVVFALSDSEIWK